MGDKVIFGTMPAKITMRSIENLSATHPEIVREWAPGKNRKISADDTTSESDISVWWLCENGHYYLEKVSNRTKKIGCPYCDHMAIILQLSGAQRLSKNIQERIIRISKECHQGTKIHYLSRTFIENMDMKCHFKCPNGHIYYTTMKARFQGKECPLCEEKKHVQ